MQAQTNVLTSVAEEVLEQKPKTSRLSAKLIDKMREENIRENRQAFQIPVLSPLGDEKFWGFKVFPRAYKNWGEMNEKD